MADHTYIVDDTICFTDKIKYEFDTLIKFVYENFVLDHEKMENINKNLLNGAEYDHEDDDYNKRKKIHYFYPGNNELEYHYCDQKNIQDDFLHGDEKYIASRTKLLKELKEYFSDPNNNYANLKLAYASITLCNLCGINSDYRGVRKLDWCMLYTSEMTITSKLNSSYIMFPQIIKALYDIKSHKFEYWYELYIKCKIKNISPNAIGVYCIYDHGS